MEIHNLFYFCRCDAMSAICKREIYKFVKRGNDVTTEEEFAEALVSNDDEVQNMLVILGSEVKDIVDNKDVGTHQIKHISTLNNFMFEDEGIRVQKQANVGSGKLIRMKEKHQTARLECSIIKPGVGKIPFNSSTPASYCAPTKSKLIHKKVGKDLEQEAIDDDLETPSTPEETTHKVFYCTTEELCTKRFLRASDKTKHEMAANHLIPAKTCSDKQTFLLSHFERHNAGNVTRVGSSESSRYMATVVQDLSGAKLPESIEQPEETVFEESLSQGYALKKQSESKHFPQRVKDYVRGLFTKGELDKNEKVTPAEAAALMLDAKDESGFYLFSPSECLDENQIRGLFSRIKAQLKADKEEVSEIEVQEAAQEMAREEKFDQRLRINEMFSTAFQELNDAGPSSRDNLESHPIKVNGHNICALVQTFKASPKNSGLHKVALEDLKAIAKKLKCSAKNMKKPETFGKKFVEYLEEHCSCPWV